MSAVIPRPYFRGVIPSGGGGISSESVVTYSTVSALNADPSTFDADTVVLDGLNAADDGAGGLFVVDSGLTADGKDFINLTGVHSGKQLRRITNWFSLGEISQQESGFTETTISALDTPVPVLGTWSETSIGTDWSVNSSGIATCLRERTHLVQIVLQFRLAIASPSGVQRYRVFVDKNNQTTSGPGPTEQPPGIQLGGDIHGTTYSILSVSPGDTLQIKVAQIEGAIRNVATISNERSPVATISFFHEPPGGI